MGKYTDDEIRAMPKITAKIAADYLGISPMMVTLGMNTIISQFEEMKRDLVFLLKENEELEG